MKIGIGWSKNHDSFEAGAEAAKIAFKKMGKEKPDFVLVFSTEEYEQKKMLEGVRLFTKDSSLVGCCGAGIITEDGLSSEGVAVLTLKSEKVRVVLGKGEGISKNGRVAGKRMAEEILEKGKDVEEMENQVLLMLPDGFTGNVCDVIEGAYNVLGASYKFVGGGAGDNLRFLKTYQFINYEVLRDAVSGALLASELPFGVGVKHGWSPIGKPMIVTKSKGNVVQEIDGKPAFEAYLDCFGKETPGLNIAEFGRFAMKHPLGIPERNGEYTIRDPLKTEKDGSIVCVAEVPENSVVRIMEGDNNSVIKAAKDAAKQAMDMMGRKASAAIIFDCVSRLLLLEKDATKELDVIRSVVGRDVPVIGFFTFGEIAGVMGPPVFCNKTCVVLTLPKD